MATFIVRMLQGIHSPAPGSSFYACFDELAESFTAVNVLADSEDGADLEVRWSEQRVINNVISEEGTTSIYVSLEKTGYLSVRESGRYWYASGLGRHSVALSSSTLTAFALTPIKLDLRKSLSRPAFRGMLLEHVRISDLSVDSISSLKAEVPSCSQSALTALIKGTDARVTSFAVTTSSETHLTFSTNGAVKVRLPSFNWEQAVREMETLMSILL